MSKANTDYAIRIYTARWPDMDASARRRAVAGMKARREALKAHIDRIDEWLRKHEPRQENRP